jgi:hypothetical protein
VRDRYAADRCAQLVAALDLLVPVNEEPRPSRRTPFADADLVFQRAQERGADTEQLVADEAQDGATGLRYGSQTSSALHAIRAPNQTSMARGPLALGCFN